MLRQVNQIIREFLRHGHKETRDGHGPVHWQHVCQPLELGGLGIPDLHCQGVFLRVRWLWLQRTDPTRPWVHLHLPSDPDASSIFRASTSWSVGNGWTCRFWMDPWIDGKAISDLAPSLLPLVPRHRRKCTVADELNGRSWVVDLHGALTPGEMVEYVQLWRLLRPISLSSPLDHPSWRWTTDAKYSARSCYRALFVGSTTAPFWHNTWRSWGPLRVNVFTWLADLDHCWIFLATTYNTTTASLYAIKPMKLCNTSSSDALFRGKFGTKLWLGCVQPPMLCPAMRSSSRGA